MSITTITYDNYNTEVAACGQDVLLDFWASWCGPCRMLSPVVDELSEEVSDVHFGKVNVDEQPELARKFGVMSIPTLVLIRNGREAARSVGVKPKAAILSMLGK